MNKILRRDQFLKKNTINEAIVTNDIPWGDSLVGRLINSLARKATIVRNAKKIDKVINNLRTQFDALVAAGKVEIDKSKLIKLQLWTIFSTLKKQVADGEDVSIILATANNLRDAVNSISELEDKDNILEAIDSFIKFLEGLKDSDGEGEGEGEEEGEEEGEDDEKNKVKVHSLIKKNLESLKSLLSQYKTNGGNSGRGVSVNKETPRTVVKYTTKEGDTVAKIVASPENKLKWDSAKIWAENIKPKSGKKGTPVDGALKKQLDNFTKDPKIAPKGNKDNMTLAKDLPLILGYYKEEKGKLVEVNERFFLSEAKFGVGGGEDRGNIKSGESHLEQAFSKLKKDIDVLISSKEKGIGIDSVFIDNISKSTSEPKNRETIYKLYLEIKRYLDGDKKLTLQNREPLYKKESIEILSDNKKIVVVAEKIARFCKRSFQFEGENLYAGLGDLGGPLEEFNKTMKEIMGSISSNPVKKKEKPEKENPEEKKPEEKPEEKESEKQNNSFIFRYGSFVNSLLERNSNSDEIQTKFDEFFTAEIQEKISFTEEEVGELKKTKERPDGKLLIMDAADPIISIIQIFNRAFRLHTPGAIPSGRSGGKVSVSVFNEYEYMGGSSGGSPEQPGGGPYRNIKIFDKWKAGVDSILADTKYRPLFSEDTTLSFRSSESGAGDDITKPGKMLLRFINKLNDDNTMYSGGSSYGKEGSAMYKFYEEYFGIKPDWTPDAPTQKDIDINDKVTVAMPRVKTKWVKLGASRLGTDLFEIIKRGGDDNKGLSFKFTVKNTDKNQEITYYACINDILSNKGGEMFFSQLGYAFDTDKVEFPTPNGTPTTTVNYGLISGSLKEGSACDIKYIDLKDATNANNPTSPIKYVVTNIEVLMSVDDNKPYKDFTLRLTGKYANLNNNVVIAKKIFKG